MPIISAKNIQQPRKASIYHQQASKVIKSSALTDEDLEARRGCFTGSSSTNLMSKSSKAGSWSSYTSEMICDFGKVAKDYIFEKIMERKTGIVTRMKQTSEMRYGNEHEDDIFNPLAERLLNKEGIILEKCKFIRFHGGIMAGATPDGRGYQIGDADKNNKIAIEIKCCLTAGTFRHRLETANTDKNCDYWQCIMEMITLGVDRLIYAIGHPPKSFDDPVPDFEMLEVRMSKVHKKALLDRINLADKIANDFITNNREYKDFEQSMMQSISEWRPPEERQQVEIVEAKIKSIPLEAPESPLNECAW